MSDQENRVDGGATGPEGDRLSGVDLVVMPKPPKRSRVRPILMIGLVSVIVLLVWILGVSGIQDDAETALFWAVRILLLLLVVIVLYSFFMYESSATRRADKLIEMVSSSNERLKLLLEAEREIVSTLDLDDALDATLRFAARVVGSQLGALYLWDRAEDVLIAEVFMGVDAASVVSKRVPLGSGLVGTAAAERKLTIADSTTPAPPGPDPFGGMPDVETQVAVPMFHGERLVGVLLLATKGSHIYEVEEQGLLLAVADLASLAVNNARLYSIARRSLEAAAARRNTSALVIEEMKIGLMTVNRQGRIVLFNREAARITGYDTENLHSLRVLPEGALEVNRFGELGRDVHEVIRTGIDLKNRAASILLGSGQLLRVTYSINPLVNAGETQGATVVFQEDMSHHIQPQLESEVDFQWLLRLLGSHIERNFLRPLSRLMETVGEMDTKTWNRNREELSKTLSAGSTTLTGLFKDVESYINCAITREWDSRVSVGLGPIVKETLDGLLNRSRFKGVVATVELDGLPPAFGYERMIRDVISRVLENATRAAAEGGRQVKVSGTGTDSAVKLRVTDNGPGVPLEIRGSLFAPFVSGESGPSGIGLAIVRREMEALGGRITVEETGKEGTTFLLELPVAMKSGEDTGQGARTI